MKKIKYIEYPLWYSDAMDNQLLELKIKTRLDKINLILNIQNK